MAFSVIDANASQPVALAAMVLDACDSGLTAQTCTLAPSPVWAGLRRDLATTRALRAGKSVVLLVGSVFPQPPQVAPYGRFEVRVRELPTVGEGQRCGDRIAACRETMVCNYHEGGVCRTAGGLGQPCRGDRGCKEGLACAANDRCERALAPGDPCMQSDQYQACPSGTTCQFEGTEYRCVPLGAAMGGCRATAPRCDAGLACDGLYCRPAGTEGATCTNAVLSCAEGTHSMTTDPGRAQCLRDGAMGGRCVLPGFTCEAGLACSTRDQGPLRCLPAVALGGACDPLHERSACIDATCVSGVCVADGALGAACRASAAPCDAGFGCVGVPPRCQRLAVVGGDCSRNACPAGSSCAEGVTGTARCVADGAARGRCRLSDPVCDAGLACTNSGDPDRAGQCLPAAGEGMVCNPSVPTTACVRGLACNAMGRCAPEGSAGTPCRLTEPLCDAGSECLGRIFDARGTCLATVPRGAPCGASGVNCASGLVCGFRTPAASYTCEPTGSLAYRPCRDASPRCDPGLACGWAATQCVPEDANGERCDATETSRVCAPGTSCLLESIGVATCRPDGAAGARCRTTEPPCDTGLRCSGPALSVHARCM